MNQIEFAKLEAEYPSSQAQREVVTLAQRSGMTPTAACFFAHDVEAAVVAYRAYPRASG